MADVLERLINIHKQKGWVKEEYDVALKACIDAGYSNVKIAEALYLSEAAIRMYRKRHNL